MEGPSEYMSKAHLGINSYFLGILALEAGGSERASLGLASLVCCFPSLLWTIWMGSGYSDFSPEMWHAVISWLFSQPFEYCTNVFHQLL